MFYIVKRQNSVYFLKEISDAIVTDATYHYLTDDKDLGYTDVKGQFGRKDYAQLWCDMYNNVITREMLHKELGI